MGQGTNFDFMSSANIYSQQAKRIKVKFLKFSKMKIIENKFR